MRIDVIFFAANSLNRDLNVMNVISFGQGMNRETYKVTKKMGIVLYQLDIGVFDFLDDAYS